MVLVKMTREDAWKYAKPTIVPGGIPVDLQNAAQARVQAEAAQGHSTETAGAEPGAHCACDLHIAVGDSAACAVRILRGERNCGGRDAALLKRWRVSSPPRLSLLLKFAS